MFSIPYLERLIYGKINPLIQILQFSYVILEFNLHNIFLISGGRGISSPASAVGTRRCWEQAGASCSGWPRSAATGRSRGPPDLQPLVNHAHQVWRTTCRCRERVPSWAPGITGNTPLNYSVAYNLTGMRYSRYWLRPKLRYSGYSLVGNGN